MWIKSSPVVDSNFRILRALDYLRAQHGDPALDLHRAAAAVHLSTFHLSRLLKKSTGIGFAHHLRTARVNHAEELLRTTNLTVKEVAASVGYASTNALDRNFKAVHAVTPSVYRLRTVNGRYIETAETTMPALLYEPADPPQSLQRTIAGAVPPRGER
jgi:transcriptional regulator GlxA family with amidase domain